MNTASRIGPSDRVGKAKISTSTYGLLWSDSGLNFEGPRMVEAKGNREMEISFEKRA